MALKAGMAEEKRVMCLHLGSKVIIENDLCGFNELHGLQLHSKEILFACMAEGRLLTEGIFHEAIRLLGPLENGAGTIGHR